MHQPQHDRLLDVLGSHHTDSEPLGIRASVSADGQRDPTWRDLKPDAVGTTGL